LGVCPDQIGQVHHDFARLLSVAMGRRVARVAARNSHRNKRAQISTLVRSQYQTHSGMYGATSMNEAALRCGPCSKYLSVRPSKDIETSGWYLSVLRRGNVDPDQAARLSMMNVRPSRSIVTHA
jgi:hypothetical protein